MKRNRQNDKLVVKIIENETCKMITWENDKKTGFLFFAQTYFKRERLHIQQNFRLRQPNNNKMFFRFIIIDKSAARRAAKIFETKKFQVLFRAKNKH